ncbi:hypothetical protein BHYA_0165g00250 [Botrytis hyacinthi]|uniref:Extracellular membrane protein CFEM domain-containing protein n=1 Tax=Botrytis hyacinthi TaxID=278943 RepID=A0A4Z1GN44_9HELO|nr:hypothetical protein BHYA_0165g00250 [Botrytis hyacinthi]
MKASNIIQALMALAFQAQTSMTVAVTTSVEANTLLVGGCAGVTQEYQLQCYKDQCPQPTDRPLGSSYASYPPTNQLACYKSKCPELAAQVTTSQALTQQTSPPLIRGCRGVAPQYQLQCYKGNCREPAGPPGSSCASYPPEYQLACYKSKCDSKPEMITSVEVALQSPVGASLGQDCAGVAPEYELECFQKLCPIPGPPGVSCGSFPPQYQLDCYKNRCHEVYTSTAPAAPQKTPENDGEDCASVALENELECFYRNYPMPGLPGFSCASLPPQYQTDFQKTPSPAQQTSNAAQQSPGSDGSCIRVAPENQLQCYRDNCPMSGSIGYACGTLPLDYQLQCYKAHCDDQSFIGAELPEECSQKECFKLFCASLPVQYQLQYYRQHCGIPDLSELISGFGNSLGGILDASSVSGSSDDDGSSASGSSDDDGVNGSDGKGGLLPGRH